MEGSRSLALRGSVAEDQPDQHHASGHRARLRARLLGGGDEALGDHEVIEYLLMTAIPRRDVKPLARTLLDRAPPALRAIFG